MSFEDPFNSISTFETANGSTGQFHDLNALEKSGLCHLDSLPFTIRCLLEAALRKCDGFLVTEEDVKKIADHYIQIPRCDELLVPLLATVPLQLLSYHIALMRNCNVDQPRNLAKSVTVE